MIRLSKRIQIRQQCMATAQVYLKRFYSRVEIRRTNPYLVITTAVYLACKMEEAPQHIRLVVTEARTLWADFISLDTSRIGECEFYLISEMNAQLLVHQPYRVVASLRADMPMMTEEDAALARSVINDSYMTDLPLFCAPHTIALAAILLSLVLRPNTPSTSGPLAQAASSNNSAAAGLAAAQAALSQAQARLMGVPPHQYIQTPPPALPQQQQQHHGHPSMPQHAAPGMPGGPVGEPKRRTDESRITRVQQFAAWLADSTVDIAAMVDATQEIISFYECHEQYNEKLTREQINRFVKARGLDK